MKLHPRDGWLAAGALAGFALVALAARAAPGQSRTPVVERSGAPRQPSVTARPPSDQATTPPPEAANDFRVPWALIQAVLIATVLLAVLGLAVVFWPRLTAWPRSRRRAPRPLPAVESAPDDLRRQVSDTLRSASSQLAGGQIRDGVILCWRRLEQTAEAAGLRRQPSETSTDLVERLLASLPLSEAPLNRLAALYREARFSSHPIPAEAVAQARADLVRLRAELEAAGTAAAGQSRA